MYSTNVIFVVAMCNNFSYRLRYRNRAAYAALLTFAKTGLGTRGGYLIDSNVGIMCYHLRCITNVVVIANLTLVGCKARSRTRRCGYCLFIIVSDCGDGFLRIKDSSAEAANLTCVISCLGTRGRLCRSIYSVSLGVIKCGNYFLSYRYLAAYATLLACLEPRYSR